jgi:hypothetical protein
LRRAKEVLHKARYVIQKLKTTVGSAKRTLTIASIHVNRAKVGNNSFQEFLNGFMLVTNTEPETKNAEWKAITFIYRIPGSSKF